MQCSLVRFIIDCRVGLLLSRSYLISQSPYTSTTQTICLPIALLLCVSTILARYVYSSILGFNLPFCRHLSFCYARFSLFTVWRRSKVLTWVPLPRSHSVSQITLTCSCLQTCILVLCLVSLSLCAMCGFHIISTRIVFNELYHLL